MNKLRIFTLGFVGLLLVFTAGVWFARVPIATSAAKSYLSSLGLPQADFTIKQLDLGKAVILNVTLGDEISVQQMSVQYTLGHLLRGEVASIDIGGADIDVSKPDEGSLKAIQEAVAIASDGKESQSTSPFPQIIFEKISVSRRDDQSRMTAVLEGRIDPNGRLEIVGSLNGTAENDDLPVVITGESLRVLGNLNDQKFQITPSEIMLKSAAETPDFPAAIISLSGLSDLNALSGELSAKLEDGTSILSAQINHDLAQKNGEANVHIDDLRVGEGAIKPELWLGSFGVPPTKGRLRANVRVYWTEDQVSADGELQGQNVEVEFEGQSITAAQIDLTTKTSARLGEQLPIPDTKVLFHKVSLTSGESSIRIPTLKGRIGGSLDDIKANLTGRLVGRFADQEIPEASFQATLSGSLELMELEGAASSFGGELQPAFQVTIEPVQRSAEFNFELSNTKLGTGGVDLSKWSPVPIIGEINGKVSGNFKDSAYRLKQVDFEGRNLEVATTDGVRAKLSLRMTAQDVKPDTPFEVQFNNLSGTVGDGERAVRFEGGRFIANVDERGARADFELAPLAFTPNSKSELKTPFTVSAEGTATPQAVNFSSFVKTPLTGPLLEINGQHDLQSSRGAAKIKMLTLPFTNEGLQPSDFVRKSFDEVELSGDVAASGEITWGATGANGKGVLEISDLTAYQDGLFVEGLDGRLNIDSLMPLTISKAQTVSVDGMFVGIPLGRSEITFRLEQAKEAPILFLDQMRIEMFQGAAEISDGVIDLASESNTLQMKLFRLSLKELMALGEFEDVNATGALSGVIPLNFNGETLIIDEAVLAAEEPGVLQITSEQARQALSSGGSQTKLLFDILENFKYSDLSLRINKPESGEDVISLHAKGGNPNVENNRPVILNVNLSTNFDKIFNTVLEGYRLSEEALRATVRNRKK
ncbi:MAG: YdbH domain-containing protein [Sneathiella sp.]|nr:YdbH domain-containing protein [Sneathiella sp.]